MLHYTPVVCDAVPVEACIPLYQFLRMLYHDKPAAIDAFIQKQPES
jgi:hypothetical protein